MFSPSQGSLIRDARLCDPDVLADARDRDWAKETNNNSSADFEPSGILDVTARRGMRKRDTDVYLHEGIDQERGDSACDKKRIQEPYRHRRLQDDQRGRESLHVSRMANAENPTEREGEKCDDPRPDKPANGIRVLRLADFFLGSWCPGSMMCCLVLHRIIVTKRLASAVKVGIR